MLRNVNNYEELYRVSDDGDIISRSGKILKPHSNSRRNGYCSVMLCKGGTPKREYIHRIVARAFPEICGEWFEGCEIDHINGITTDNRAVNLRVCTKRQNMQNPLTVKRISESADRVARSERMKGDKNPAKHYTDEWRKHIAEAQTLKPNTGCFKAINRIDGENETIYNSLTEASKQNGIQVCQISAAALGRQKTAGGFRWTYI